MKFLTSIASLSMAAALAIASPIAKASDNLYALRVSSKDAQLDGKYLSVFDNVVGIFPGRQTLFVTASESSKKGCVELHLHPTGIIDHALGLVGEGVKELHDIANPASSPGADWTSFAMNSAGDPGEPNLGSLSYTAKGGRWVVFPAKAGGEWKVTWLDGSSITTQNYMPIDLVYEGAMTISQ
ncbi:uncharacterized protein E0L32_003670 [Thyridium curvatum]|uniref:Uncharacterized protein n=1 Tax=Thyridium curvatum TaxID=1093900 RepID=A0A507BHC6_9PEZI|nr:uncharacterized protein E0L32_003670 [Thyridium curvatum]TPX16729.1 hypothetical protein E0L32_003670 [Thyridium curvatum]